MSFDAEFERGYGGPALEGLGEAVTYSSPSGVTIGDVFLIVNETHEGLNGGEWGSMKAPKRTGYAFRVHFCDLKPEKNGWFVRADGSKLVLHQPPEGPDSIGQYSFDFG